MADLSRVREREDRGQIILIAGFVLAVAFVALALILNSVIFTENLATRSESVGGPGPIETRDVVGDGVGDLMAFANANNNTDDADPRNNLTKATAALGNGTSAQFALQGQSVDVTYLFERNGTRIVQDNASRNFTSNSTAENWTVVPDSAQLDILSGSGNADRIRDFRFTVNRSSLEPASNCPFGECFRVNVSTVGSNLPVWGVAFGDAGSEVNVTSYNYTSSGRNIIGSCKISGGNVTVSLTTGRVGNDSAIPVEDPECQAINFAEGVSRPYNVTYYFGDDARGTYSLITSRNRDLSKGITTPPILSPNNFEGPGSDESPRATHAVYNVTVRAVYVVDTVEYNTTVRVAPGEPE